MTGTKLAFVMLVVLAVGGTGVCVALVGSGVRGQADANRQLPEKGEDLREGRLPSNEAALQVVPQDKLRADRPARDGIQVTLASARQEYRPGEAVNLILTIKNNGKDEFSYLKDKLRELNDFEITGPDGKAVKQALNPVEFGGQATFLKVKAGESVTIQDVLKHINLSINLSKVPGAPHYLRHMYYPMDAPGTYRLRIKVGDVTSNELAIKVLRTDGFGDEVKGLRARVSLAKEKFPAGVPIEVKYVVKNVSKEEQTLWHGGFWPNHLVIVRNADGKEPALTEFGQQRRKAFSPGGERFKNVPVKVPAGGEDTAYEQYDLTKLYDLSTPGRYTVQYVYEEKQGGWEGRLPSNEVVFEITPVAAEEEKKDNGRAEGTDPHGDALPSGAVARMGTPRFRHGGPVLSMAYLADGKILATGGYIGTRRETRMGRIRLWDTTTGKELRQFQLKGTAHVAGLPDGMILAGADESEGIIHLWEAATGKEIQRLKSSQSGFEGLLPVAFSADGKKLAAGGHEPRIWEIETGKLLHSVNNQQESVIDLAFSVDGNILAVNYCDLVVPKLFQVDPWKVLASLRPERPGGLLDGPRLEHFAFSSDKKTLAVTTEASGWIYLLGATDGKEIRRIHAHQIVKDMQFPFGEHRDHECISALVFSPDGKTLASAASDKAIRLWEVATGKEIKSFPADTYTIGSLAFAPDGKSLAWANSGGVIRIYDLQTGKASNSHEGHQGVVTGVALSLDGKTLITAGTDATIRLWETASGKERRRFEGHQGSIASIHLSRDGKTLASVSPADKTVRVWELSTGKELRRFRVSATYCEAAWLPDSRTLIIRRCDDPAVYFCDVATGKETRKIEKTWLGVRGMFYPTNVEAVHEGNILAVSPDGKMLVTSVNSSGGSFHLWDTTTGKELPGLWPDPHNQIFVGTAVFSPDSKTLVIGSSYPTTIQVWDIATRRERQQFGSHLILKDSAGEEYEVPTYMKITSMAISPNGRTLATAGWDPTIRLWDIATGKEHPRLEGHRGTVTSLAWSADGKTLVSGSNDGTALVWDVSR